MSPYVRHNIISLSTLWDVAGKAPQYDRDKYRDELLWQEYARHLYARIGKKLFSNLRFEQNLGMPRVMVGQKAWLALILCSMN